MCRLVSALLLLAFSSFATAELLPSLRARIDKYADYEIRVATQQQVQAMRKKGEHFFVAFVSPEDCPDCGRLIDVVPKIRYHLANSSSRADFYLMDFTDKRHQDLIKELDVPGVPSVYFFQNSRQPILYEERNITRMVAYAEKVANFKVDPLKTVAEFRQFKNDNADGAVVLFLENLSREWMERARDVLSLPLPYPVAFILRGSLPSEGHDDQLYVFRDNVTSSMHRSTFEHLRGEILSGNPFVKFIKRAVLPLVSSFPHQAKEVFEAEVPSILFFISSAIEIQYAREWLAKLAEGYRGKLVVVTADRDDGEVSKALKHLGARSRDTEELTSVRIFNAVNQKQYWYEAEVDDRDFVDAKEYKYVRWNILEEMNLVTLSRWLDKYFAGEVPEHVKSQRPSAVRADSPLKKLVADNFEVIFDKNVHVFVKYFAPWCQHCKDMAPEWEALAHIYNGNQRVIIAEVDMTENEVDDKYAPITYYPTIRLYKAGTKEVVEYHGGRTVNDFVEFLEEEMSGRKTTGKDEL